MTKSKSMSTLKSSLDVSNQRLLSGIILNTLINLAILVYIINLEDKTCNCLMDQRHTLIKYYSVFMILVNVVFLMTGVHMTKMAGAFSGVLALLSLVNFIALFTYVGDLDKTGCKCAVEKQMILHNFLFYGRYVPVIVLSVYIVMLIVLFLKM